MLLAETHLEYSRESIPSGSLGKINPNPGWMQAKREPRTGSLYQTSHIQLHHATVWRLLIRVWERDENDNSEDRWRARMVFAELRAMKKRLERSFCRWWVRPLCMRKPQRQQQIKTLNTTNCRHRNVSTGASWRLTYKVNSLESLGSFVSDFSQQNTVGTDMLVKFVI